MIHTHTHILWLQVATEMESRDARASKLQEQLEFCQGILEDEHRRVINLKQKREKGKIPQKSSIGALCSKYTRALAFKNL
jgi:hypothetical protein